jgi:hypothetical protein
MNVPTEGESNSSSGGLDMDQMLTFGYQGAKLPKLKRTQPGSNHDTRQFFGTWESIRVLSYLTLTNTRDHMTYH